jgi:hypothetical protein
MLVYPCPKTGHSVSTAIETTEDDLMRMRQLNVSVWCPHCNSSHMIPISDTWIEPKNRGQAAAA